MTKLFSFTTKRIEAAKHLETGKSTEYTDKDVNGLKLEVTPTGRKTFYCRYTFRGRKYVIRIGQFPYVTLEDARRIARSYRADLETGINPKDEKREKCDENTFSEFAEEKYIPYAVAHKSSAKDDVCKLRLYLIPAFGKLKLSEITRHQITTYHGEIKTKRTPATANRHLALIKRMLGLAVEWDCIKSNAAIGIKLFAEENCRETYLSAAEARQLLAAMSAEKNQTACAAIKLLLLTGVRRQEALSAQWDHVDISAKTWLLPKTKAKRPRRVTLSDAAIEVLVGQKERSQGSPFVFPGRDPSKPLCDPKKTLQRLLLAAGIAKPLRIHDLRHSFASLLVGTGASLYTVQHLLGHASPTTTERYAHLGDNHLRENVESLSQLLG